jgi:hypothetical protein
MSTQVTLTEIDIVDLSTSSGAIGSSTTAHAGSRGGNMLDASACVIIKKHLSRRYRGGHPRTYLPAGIVSDVATPQTWAGALLASAAGAWVSLMAAIAAHTWSGGTLLNEVNVSYYQGFHNVTLPSGRQTSRPTLRATPLVDNVASITANPNIGSQRRRLQTS